MAGPGLPRRIGLPRWLGLPRRFGLSRRIGLPGRITLIVIVALIAGWLTLLAATYIASGVGRSAALPPPERLAALARLLEQAEGARRADILEAVTTPFFSPRLGPGPLAGAAGTAGIAAQDAAAYRAGLGGRPLVLDHPGEGLRLRRFFAGTVNAVEFRIGLATGEVLTVNTVSPFIVAPSGLPAGFPAGIAGILIALAALIMLHREIRPLSRLAAAVDRADPEGEPLALPPIRARSPEVRALTAAFARLQERVATLIRARLALIGGIQHDLRTFATRLRLRIDRIADPAERERAAGDIASIIALLDDALLASRAGASELDEELIDMAHIAEAEVADRQAEGARASLAIAPGAEGAQVLGDRLALRRIIANLVGNALKYGHAAHLGLSVSGRTCVLTVDDEGPGIPPEHRALLLEPFTRMESSRARSTGGAGLGLAIVQALTAAHGGTLTIADAPTGGARLVLHLPLFLRG